MIREEARGEKGGEGGRVLGHSNKVYDRKLRREDGGGGKEKSIGRVKKGEDGEEGGEGRGGEGKYTKTSNGVPSSGCHESCLHTFIRDTERASSCHI